MILTHDTDLWLDTVSYLTVQDIRAVRQTCQVLFSALPYAIQDMNVRSLALKLKRYQWAQKMRKCTGRRLVLTKQLFGEVVLYKRVIQQAHPHLASTIEKKLRECVESVPPFRIYLLIWHAQCALPDPNSLERKLLCISTPSEQRISSSSFR